MAKKENEKMTLEQYQKKYSKPYNEKAAKSFLFIFAASIGVIIAFCLFSIVMKIYEISNKNNIALYISIAAAVLLFLAIYGIPLFKIKNTKSFITNVNSDNVKEAKKYNKKLREDIADKMIDLSEKATDVSWYSEERIGKLTEEEKYVKKLYKVKDSPYFGSIIFNDELIYIGLTSVKKDLDHLVCDWRAPICGLYYDYGLGKAEYKCPDGVEKGTITRKRQYKIEKSKLKQVFDTSEQISDEMLQNVLAQSSSDKMKNIVNTIQKEQNEVIRNSEDRNFIVQGIAGSGKTSVALHRIAYLLYKLDYLTSSNVVIFSPNNIFAEYISNVLPDLGEENTMQTTYHEFASSFIEEYKGVEPYSAFTERYYKGVRQDNDLIRFKLSDEMGTAIEEFVKFFTKASRFVKELEYKKVKIDQTELNDLLINRFGDKPLYERIELIADKVNNRYYKGLENDFNHIKNKLFKIVNFPVDCKEIYKAFFKSAIFSN